jgi:hypothetical protein
MAQETFTYREFLQAVISPVALSVIERMKPVIHEIYNLDELLDEPVPSASRMRYEERFSERLGRIVRLLPPDVSPMANEIFTAIEFLIYEIHGEPILIGLALARLEELSDEIKSDPLLHSLVTGRAN